MSDNPVKGIEKNDTNQKANETSDTRDDVLGNVNAGGVEPIGKDTDGRFQNGKSRIDTQQEEVDEQEANPMNSTLKSTKDDRPGCVEKGC